MADFISNSAILPTIWTGPLLAGAPNFRPRVRKMADFCTNSAIVVGCPSSPNGTGLWSTEPNGDGIGGRSNAGTGAGTKLSVTWTSDTLSHHSPSDMALADAPAAVFCQLVITWPWVSSVVTTLEWPDRRDTTTTF